MRSPPWPESSPSCHATPCLWGIPIYRYKKIAYKWKSMPLAEPFSLSVIICTRDRASLLDRCLQRFKETPSDGLELIVVDNNSSDDTKAVVQEFAESASFDVRYIFEHRTGLSHARNRGIAEASGSIIAFTDDDCLVDHQWVSRILNEFSADRSLAVLGGRV